MSLNIHYDNAAGYAQPVMLIRDEKGKIETIPASSSSEGWATFQIKGTPTHRAIKFMDEANHAMVEGDHLWRSVPAQAKDVAQDIWLRAAHAFVYIEKPAAVAQQSAEEVVAALHYKPQTYISETGGRMGLGANLLAAGGAQFGLFHPHAAQVYLVGDFNGWQYPGADQADASKFLPMTLHRGYFGTPNVWLTTVENAKVGDAYKFVIVYGTLSGDQKMDTILTVDPYARVLGMDYERNDSLICDPSAFGWNDGDYHTPLMHDLVIYELHASGFTMGHADITPEHQGKYAGIVDRLHAGYFDRVGATALSIMPLAEVPTPQGAQGLGYNTSLFMAMERDFGTPDELRTLVNEVHQQGIAVVIDQVFNHAANEFNPLWGLILDHPDERNDSSEGGLYFSGATPWGNRMATERAEMQNMFIDACKQAIVEYHVDGFRYDFTHSSLMDHGFMLRMAAELQALKPDVILIAENMPNESDLNREGFNGYAQWCNAFHDGCKALLREGQFEGFDNDPHVIGDMFYFSKNDFAAHTNNVINYCESHDENSMAFEVATNPILDHPAAKDRKSRLGLFATIVALGQPMIYMGQEFGVERERNYVHFEFPANLEENGFFQWASRLMCLRRRYTSLKLHGYNPIEDGQFEWIATPWSDESHGLGKRMVAWRARATENPYDVIVVAINFENTPVTINLELGIPGKWVRLASIDEANDIAPDGTNSIEDAYVIVTEDGCAHNFTLPDSSAFIYKWEAGL